MPSKQATDLAGLYVALFMSVNILLLPIGLYLSGTLFTDKLNVYGGIYLLAMGGLIGTVQPILGIYVSVCYLRKYTWARRAMIAFLGLILAFWTLVFVLFCLLFGMEIVYLLVWAGVAALITPGLVLIYRKGH